MKKVLFCIQKLTGGGAERVVSVWASQLAEKGYAVSILTHGRVDNEYPVSNKVDVLHVTETHDEYVKLNSVKKLILHRKLVKRINPHVIISFLPSMEVIVMLSTIGLRKKKVETVRVSPWNIGGGSIIKFLWKKCINRSYKTIIQTAEQGEFFSKKVQNKCVVIPNPIAAQYKENISREHPEQITRFIAAGRIDPQKNYPLMIKAFASVAKERDLTLDIFGAGDENYIKSLQALIDELKMTQKIKLRERTPNLIDEYKNSHAYLMTSDFEGMPNALAEAMATELVCISSDCRTGPKDLIDDNENGFLFETGNQKELEELIEKVACMDRDTAINIGKKAREKVLNFLSEENSLNKLMEIIDKA